MLVLHHLPPTGHQQAMELQELELCFVHHLPMDMGLGQAKNKQTKRYEEKPGSAHTKRSASAKGAFKQCCKQAENSEHKGVTEATKNRKVITTLRKQKT